MCLCGKLGNCKRHATYYKEMKNSVSFSGLIDGQLELLQGPDVHIGEEARKSRLEGAIQMPDHSIRFSAEICL